MLQADYGWLFARIARMPETRSTTLAHLPAGTYATSTRASRQGLSCKGGRFHASDDYVYYELGGVQEGIWPTVRFRRSYSPLYQGLRAPLLTRCPGRSRPPRPFSTTTSRFLPTSISAPSISPQAPFLRSRARGARRRVR